MRAEIIIGDGISTFRKIIACDTRIVKRAEYVKVDNYLIMDKNDTEDLALHVKTVYSRVRIRQYMYPKIYRVNKVHENKIYVKQIFCKDGICDERIKHTESGASVLWKDLKKEYSSIVELLTGIK